MAFITVTGETQIAAKQGAAQVLNITHFVLANIAGLGAEPVNRIEAMPAAGNIMATLPVTSSGYVNGNQVVYSLVMDSSIGDFDFNWVGLKDADGVLIACTYTPLIQKRKTTGAVPGNNLTRNFLIAFSGIQATTAIDVPAATWQIDFNARLWGIDERERLSNYDIYGHEGFFGDGWKVTRQGATTTYDVAAGVGYVGGVRIASAVTQQVTVAGPPKSVWLDVSLQGDISDVSAVVAFVVDAVAHADYTDANGFKHYVTKISDIAADGSVTDVRVSADNIVPQPEAETGTATTIRNWTAQRVRQAILGADIVGVGHIAFLAKSTAPAGYLKANGATISRTTYADLFAAIGTAFGAGDGSTTFQLPDMRGEFVRGWDDGRGVDSGRAIGSSQSDGFKSHYHDILTSGNTPAGTLGIVGSNQISGTPSTSTTGSTGGTETRPRNIALLACIKY
jgi:microcystin-dependent protein